MSCELRSEQALLVPPRPEIPSRTATNECGDEDALRSWGSQLHMPTRPPSLNAGLLTWARSYGVRSNQKVPPGLLPATSPAPTDVCAPLPLAYHSAGSRHALRTNPGSSPAVRESATMIMIAMATKLFTMFLVLLCVASSPAPTRVSLLEPREELQKCTTEPYFPDDPKSCGICQQVRTSLTWTDILS